MFMIKLNTSIPYNYSFYCPENNISLDITHKEAYVVKLSTYIKRGIHANTLICEELVDTSNGIEEPIEEPKEEIEFPSVDIDKEVEDNGMQTKEEEKEEGQIEEVQIDEEEIHKIAEKIKEDVKKKRKPRAKTKK